MQFEISKQTLLKPLTTIMGVIEKKHTLPLLSNVLTRIQGDNIFLTGTDLEVEITSKVTGITNSSQEDLSVTLPARKLTDICKSLPDEALISFNIENQRAIIKSGRSRFSLTTLPAVDFPYLEAIDFVCEFKIPQQQLKLVLEKTQFCMANQDVRYYLNGLLFELKNGTLAAVATDGHRLAYMATKDIDVDANIQIIIPRKGVSELYRLLENSEELANVSLNQNYIQVEFGDTCFSSKLIDGRFPDYSRVIPMIEDDDNIMIVNTEKLKQSLVRTSVLSNEKFRGIRFNVGNNILKLSINNPEQEEAEEELEVDYPEINSNIEIGFNVSYMIDALSAIDAEKSQIRFTTENNSCLILPVDGIGARYVVMPMRF